MPSDGRFTQKMKNIRFSADHLAKNLMTEEEYAAVQGYIRGGAQFFEPEIDPAEQTPKELLRKLINTHIAPSPLCRAAYIEV